MRILAAARDLLTNAPQFGNVNEQIDFVAEQIANVTELKDGFDAIGFSQAGQFLRAYVERYNTPPVHNLITFGSQHMGTCFCDFRAWVPTAGPQVSRISPLVDLGTLCVRRHAAQQGPASTVTGRKPT